MIFKKWLEGVDWVYGIYEEEAFKDKSVLTGLRKYVVSNKIEQHPEATGEEDDPTVWHINYIKLPEQEKERTALLIQHSMFDGWYSLLWDHDLIYVIFSTGVTKTKNIGDLLKPNINAKRMSSIVNMAKEHGLNHEYMAQNLQQGFSAYPK